MIFAGEAIFSLPFHLARFFRPSFLDAFDVSNAALGDAYAVYGLMALIAYYPGGLLADRLAPRALLSVSLLSTAAGGLYLASFPAPTELKWLYGYWGITTILLFWSAMIRYTREWGGAPTQGRAFGLLDGGRGLVAATLASIAVWLLADALGERSGFRQVILFYAGVTALAGLLCGWLVRNDGGVGARIRDGEQVPAITVLRNPVVWLQALIVLIAYCGYKGIDYYALYAVERLNMSNPEAERFLAGSAWLRPVVAVGAGWLADRWRSPSRVLLVLLAMGIAAYGVLASVGDSQAVMTVLYTSTLVSIAVVYALRGVYFALLEETAVPAVRTGTAAGLVSVVGFLPDVLFAPLAGRLLDAGGEGFGILFAVLASLFGTGLIAGGACVGRVDRKSDEKRESALAIPRSALMPAYIVSVIEVTNPTPLFKKYTEESARLAHLHGGRYVVRGKSANVVSGELLKKKAVVILEFPSMEKLLGFYHSEEYQKDCKPMREGTGIYDIGFFEAPPADKS